MIGPVLRPPFSPNQTHRNVFDWFVLALPTGWCVLFNHIVAAKFLLKILTEAHDRTRIRTRTAAYGLVPNHWSLLFWLQRCLDHCDVAWLGSL